MSEHPSRQKTRLLVVDDEESIREVLTDFLSVEGYDVVAVPDAYSALEVLETQSFQVMLVDMKMPGMNGLQFLQAARELGHQAVVIMMTGYGTVETAIAAMKSGAYDYILKPFKVRAVIRIIERGLQKQELEAENIQLREALSLYNISEEMSSTLAVGRIYDILIETTRAETQADAVALWCSTPGTKTYQSPTEFECQRSWAADHLSVEVLDRVATLNLELLSRRTRDGESLILEGAAAQALFEGGDASEIKSMLFVPLRAKNQTLGYLVGVSFGSRRAFREGKRKMLSILCGRASAAMENARLYGDLEHTFKQTIQALANLLEDKDPYTRGHSERVSKYARMIAEGMPLSSEEVERIADSALMHDIGKLGIRYEELNKVDPLTESEYEMFKSHTTRGKWILKPITFLHPLIPGVYHHHERWDGKGYPMGLRGEEIPLMARILAVADTYDAMTSHRAYRRALPHDVAVRELKNHAGTQFDPQIVEVFLCEISSQRKIHKSKTQRWKLLAEDVA